jgi:hypothetical protein
MITTQPPLPGRRWSRTPPPRISVCEAGIFVHAATLAVAMCRNARMFFTAPRGAPASCAALIRVDPERPRRTRLATCNRWIENPVAADGVAYERPAPAVSVMGR